MFSRLGMSIAVACSFLATSAFSAVARNSFDNMDVKTSYSELLQEKNARNDSLLPAFDGDKAFAEVLRLNPNFWSLGSAIILEFLLYYMTKPEFQLKVREEIYLDSTLDLF